MSQGSANNAALDDLAARAKALAAEYYALTGKPLGITGEIAELEAANKLGLELATARTPYFDATGFENDLHVRYQIKGRAVDPRRRYVGRVPSVKCDGDFEVVLLVLLDRLTYDAIEIWRAGREEVAQRLAAPGSRARNERSALGISQFKSISQRVWPTQ